MRRPLLAAALLSSCATFSRATFSLGEYWQRSTAPLPPPRVEYQDKVVCQGREAWGCADYAASTIRISRAAPFQLWRCIEEHEQTHFKGYTHPANAGLAGVWCNLTEFQPL